MRVEWIASSLIFLCYWFGMLFNLLSTDTLLTILFMKDKLKGSEKRANKSDRDHSTSGYSRRRTPGRNLNQYDEVRMTNAESQNDLREDENRKPLEVDPEREGERENRRKAEEANPRDESEESMA